MSEFEVENGGPDYAVRKAKKVISASYNVTRYAKECSIPIAAGTDDDSPFFPNGAPVCELELMVHPGLTKRSSL